MKASKEMFISGSASWNEEKSVLAGFEQSYPFARPGLNSSALATKRREMGIGCSLVVSVQGCGAVELFRHSPPSPRRCVSRPTGNSRQRARADCFPFPDTERMEQHCSSLRRVGRAAFLTTDSAEDAAARANNDIVCVVHFREAELPGIQSDLQVRAGRGKRVLGLACSISLSAQGCLSAFILKAVKRSSTTRQHGRCRHRDLTVDPEGRGLRRGSAYGDRLPHGPERSLPYHFIDALDE